MCDVISDGKKTKDEIPLYSVKRGGKGDTGEGSNCRHQKHF